MVKLLASSLHTVTPDTPHWQLALGADGVAQQLADIAQCIRIILTTPKGSDPLRPDFGCDAGNWLDLPLPAARPHLVREIRAALAWEPRIRLEAVSIEPGDSQSGGHALARLVWSATDLSVRGQTGVVALGAA